MRKWLIAAVFAYSTAGICAAETVSDAPSIVDMSEAAQGVAISAIPAPPRAIEVLTLEESDRLRAIKKARLAKKKASTVQMLSRTERRQVALLVAANNHQSGETPGLSYDPHDGYQGGIDDLDLHRSFSRPRVVDEPAAEQANADEVPDHIRLRLMLARLKAVEAQALNQVQDDGEALPAAVLARLKEARLKAVAAHQHKFG